MALHGEIKVNDKIIGDWSAVRRNLVSDDPLTYRYEYHVDLDAHAVHKRGVIEHAYADGAAALAAAVLGEVGSSPEDLAVQ